MVSFVVGILIGAATVAVVLGVWARRWRRAQAEAMREHAARRMAEMSSMTAGLAHEIKNPLSTIGMNAQLLGEAIAELDIEEQEKTRIERRIGTLTRETDRLRGILTDFLEFAGELKLHTAEVDLNEIIGELGDFFVPQAEKNRIRLRVEPAAEPVMAEVDAGQLKQALLNLLLNAAQAMEGREGGEIILRARSRSGVSEAVIHVIDTGPGIDEEKRDEIFKPYFTTKRGGSGLGLPTTRRIVEAHGGRLELVSEPGRGTDFAIVLPAAG